MTDALPPHSANAHGRFARILVFPDMYRLPSELRQLVILASITSDVLLKLASPPSRVVLRSGSMLRATVPEATVDEHRDPSSSKGHIGGSRHTPQVHPVPEAELVQLTPKRKFDCGITTGH